MTSSLCIISTKAPYQGQAAREALDAVFISASYDIPTSLLLMGDGVYQLLGHQAPEQLPRKKLTALLQSLPLYGVEHIYVDSQSLEERHIATTHLITSFQLVSPEKLPEFINQHGKILSF
ncbi:sulfurtransferase complex subunit TusC [Endozoicomonas sp. Mp262]|uniref:sulfurtransferase complex subunit TusC n=1 Tax=Endozoicomonas sp. Mp262 TaxID=2919499 RepID=UPI0021DB0453